MANKKAKNGKGEARVAAKRGEPKQAPKAKPQAPDLAALRKPVLVCQDSANGSKAEMRTLVRRLRANDEAVNNLTKAVEMGFDVKPAM